MHEQKNLSAGDDEARQRGTQKSILERRAPPTLPVLIEMRERTDWVTHWTQDSVDCLLQHRMPVVQVIPRIPTQAVVVWDGHVLTASQYRVLAVQLTRALPVLVVRLSGDQVALTDCCLLSCWQAHAQMLLLASAFFVNLFAFMSFLFICKFSFDFCIRCYRHNCPPSLLAMTDAYL